MADRIITVNSDHTISLNNAFLAVQGEEISLDIVIGEEITITSLDGYMDFVLPDGSSCFIGPFNCSTRTISTTLGSLNNVLDTDGKISFQFVLATTIGDTRNDVWKSKKKDSVIYQSIGAKKASTIPELPIISFPGNYAETVIGITEDVISATAASIVQTGQCQTATASANGLVETVQAKLDNGDFVGAAGPNGISASTATNITGLIAGDGTHVSTPTAAQVGALPIPDAGGYFATDTIDGALQEIGEYQKTRGGVLIETAALFSWKNHPLVSKIRRLYNGNIDIEYDVGVNKLLGKTYYVNQTSGIDTNSGLTPDLPLKTILAAYNKSDVVVICLCNPMTFFENGMNGTVITKPITFTTLMRQRAIIANNKYTSWSKSAGYTYVYQGTNAGAAGIGACVSSKRKDANGDFIALTKVVSIAACDAMEDSYYISGTTVYCHELGGLSPVVVLVDNTKNALTITLAAGQNVFFENVDIIGGIKFTGAGNAYARNCNFEYGLFESSVYTTCAKSIYQDCRASKSANDGFFYGSGVHSIEIRCKGMYNGDGSDDTSNGSTLHSASSIIRINGEYAYNHGPNVGDVQDGTESWNLGCSAHNSIADVGTQGVDFQSSGEAGAAHTFLDTCTGYGSVYGARCLDSGGSIGIHNGELSVVYTTNGTVYEY